jgi:hypothetical protein
MNVELRLSSEFEHALQQHVAATGEDVDSFVSEVVEENLRAEVESARRKQPRPGTFEERIKAWANRHPRLDHEIDISTESIYKGCGE